MKRFLHIGGVSMFAWVGVLAIAGAAVASALTSSDLVLSVSPEGVVTGKTLDSAEPFEMTLHLEGSPNADYDLAVTYEGGAGTCQADSATLHTNPRGKAVWTCEFDTAENAGPDPLDGTVTFVVSQEGSEAGSLVARLSVRPAEPEETDTPVAIQPVVEDPEAKTSEENHGHCVSYWAHESKEAGLAGKNRGAFLSAIAQDPEAVALKGNDPVGEKCDFSDELAAALEKQEAADAEQSAARASTKTHGKPDRQRVAK